MNPARVVAVDLAKNVAEQALWNVTIPGAWDNAERIELVGYNIRGVDETVTAGSPDCPYYILNLSPEFTPARMLYTQNGQNDYSVPLRVTSSPYCAFQYDSTQERPVVYRKKGGSQQLQSLRLLVTRSNVPQTATSSTTVSRGTATDPPRFTDLTLFLNVTTFPAQAFGQTPSGKTVYAYGSIGQVPIQAAARAFGEAFSDPVTDMRRELVNRRTDQQ
jgi:hypothetical protein